MMGRSRGFRFQKHISYDMLIYSLFKFYTLKEEGVLFLFPKLILTACSGLLVQYFFQSEIFCSDFIPISLLRLD